MAHTPKLFYQLSGCAIFRVARCAVILPKTQYRVFPERLITNEKIVETKLHKFSKNKSTYDYADIIELLLLPQPEYSTPFVGECTTSEVLLHDKLNEPASIGGEIGPVEYSPLHLVGTGKVH